MPTQKTYVVWKGRKPGIYTTWEECSAQVTGYPQAEYKSFGSLQAAQAAFGNRYEEYLGKPSTHQQWLFAPTKPLLPSICVDAACPGSPGPLEYRGVDTASGRQLFRLGPYPDGTNNIGEFLGIVHALASLQEQGKEIPVYSDSETALAWVKTGRCRTRLGQTGRNAALFDLIARAEAWLGANGVPGPLLKWDTAAWGENPADFGRK
ncbi:MAG: ribonuclease H [Chloroflexi bacterium]|nr:ribonuclease H [Chloroflexota bacterium]